MSKSCNTTLIFVRLDNSEVLYVRLSECLENIERLFMKLYI